VWIHKAPQLGRISIRADFKLVVDLIGNREILIRAMGSHPGQNAGNSRRKEENTLTAMKHSGTPENSEKELL
jgi:hypothetical protein